MVPDQKVMDKVFLKYLMDFMTNSFKESGGRGGIMMHLTKSGMEKQKMPLPPLEVQQEIVDELEGYQKIIDGCKQVVENYKPTIDIDPSWEMVELKSYISINNGQTLTEFDEDGDTAAIKVSDMNLDKNKTYITTSNNKVLSSRFKAQHIVTVDSILFPKRGAAIGTNKKRFTKIPCIIDNNCMGITVTNNQRLLSEYLFNFMLGFDLNTISKSAGIALINNPDIQSVIIPLPPIDTQKEIVLKIEEERTVIEGNKKLIEIYTQKIQNRINKVWGEE